jgi:hypothetical protein
VSKLAFFSTTLIAAIPAAFLAFLAAMAFLRHSGDMSTMLMVVTGLTLLLSVAIVAMPVAVLLKKGGPKPARTEKAEAAAADDAESEEVASDEAGDDAFADDADPFDDEPRSK